MSEQNHEPTHAPVSRRRRLVSAGAATAALALVTGLGLKSLPVRAQASPAGAAVDYSQMRFWKTLPPPGGAANAQNPDSAYGLAFTSDTDLAVGYWPDRQNQNAQIAVWDTQAGTSTSPGKMAGTTWLNVHALAASPNGNDVAVVGFDGRGQTRYVLLVFDAKTGNIIDPVAMQSGQFGTFVDAVAYSADGRRIAVGCGETADKPGLKTFHTKKAQPVDANVTVWDASGSAGDPLAVGKGQDVWCLAFTPDGGGLSYGQTQHVSQWALKPDGSFRGDAPTTQAEAEDTDAFTSLVYAPDGRNFFAAVRTDTGADRVERRDAATGNPTLTFLDPTGSVSYNVVQALALSPDGSVLAVGGQDAHNHGLVTLWDAHTGALIGSPLPTHDNQVHALAFAPDGRTLACGSDDGAVKLWTVNP